MQLDIVSFADGRSQSREFSGPAASLSGARFAVEAPCSLSTTAHWTPLRPYRCVALVAKLLDAGKRSPRTQELETVLHFCGPYFLILFLEIFAMMNPKEKSKRNKDDSLNPIFLAPPPRIKFKTARANCFLALLFGKRYNLARITSPARVLVHELPDPASVVPGCPALRTRREFASTAHKEQSSFWVRMSSYPYEKLTGKGSS